MPLQDDLCEALSTESQRDWRQLKPQGAINLTADMHYLSAAKVPEIRFAAESGQRHTSIEPEMFPYGSNAFTASSTIAKGEST